MHCDVKTEAVENDPYYDWLERCEWRLNLSVTLMKRMNDGYFLNL